MHISKNAKIVIAGLMAVLVACGIGFSDNIFKSNAAIKIFIQIRKNWTNFR